ncbi:SEC14-like protein 2 [Orchesella cincta]|uniref:SEC14-like protein 2 n=1 Tax=Orchesella cincta TaxID=48709 RepID=A0A1D2ME94_ORCCI|nr:SEC14-like protein 2 [Orchesella cincta]
MVLYNTPGVFELVLRVIRPLMSQVSRDSLKVYGQDKAQWSKALLNTADKTQLRPEYGGVYRKQ